MECFVERKDDRGQVHVWVIEGPSITRLQTQNIARADFEQARGQTVIVEVAEAKDGSRYNALLLQITFPNGKSVRLRNEQDSFER